ncbi:Transposon Tf2-9 poly, partial [Paramuricea clavata]
DGHCDSSSITTRSSIVQTPINEPSGQSIAKEYINFVIEQAIPRTITLSKVQEATKNDKELQSAGRALQSGNWKEKSISVYFAVRHEITSVTGVLLRGHRLIIPISLRNRTLALVHRGHLGIVKTKQNLRTKQLSPWSCIHVDFYGPAPTATGEHLLVMVDETTGFPEVEIMNKTPTSHTIRAFENVFARHGLPDTIKSDNGPSFQSKDVKDYLTTHGIHHHCVTPLWPQANGKMLEGHTRKSTIKEGDTVLVKQKKKNKYTTMFCPQPYKVINVRYSRVTAQRGDHVITRNISHFKKFSGAYRETVPKPESEDDITIAAPQAGQDNEQDITKDRCPLRANRGVPPDFYGW